MKEIDRINFLWNQIVEDLFYENEQPDFNYISIKKIAKRIENLEKKINLYIRELENTRNFTNFNEQKSIEEDIIKQINYLEKMNNNLSLFTVLKPTTKQGYYNYLKSVIAYL